MYVGESGYELIDSELGRFIRKFGELELLLRNIAITVNSQMAWNQASLLRISDLLQVWIDAQERFPAEDQEAMEHYVESADEAVRLRHLLVHGRWFEVDSRRGEFVLELPLTVSAARKFDVPSTSPAGSHPATVMPANPATIARARRLTSNLVGYIERNLDRWHEHFRQ